jgi:hypothetical protein
MPRAADGEWSGLPLYRCRWCRFERVNDADTVNAHEQQVHREQAFNALVNPPPTREQIEREAWLEAATLVRTLVADGKSAAEIGTIFESLAAIGEVPDDGTDAAAPVDEESALTE